MSATDLIAQRLTAQALAGPPLAGPEAVAGRLLAVQAQDLRAARLAVRARTRGLTAADVDRALVEARSVVVTWLHRGTLHLVRTEDLPWLHALTTPPHHTAGARRLAQEGLDAAAAERAVAVVERALADDGPLGRAALRERLATAGLPARGQALAHVVLRCALRGTVVRGPLAPDGEQELVLARDWLGIDLRAAAAAVDRDRALAELARRHRAGHAPATDRDLATWAGLPLRDARAALAAAGPAPAAPPPAAEPPAARLLGAFDPVLLGWHDRTWLLGEHADAVRHGGILRAVALARGRPVAAWTRPAGRVALEPFAPPLDAATEAALAADAEDVARFLGAPG